MSLRLVRAEKADIPKLVDLYFETFKSLLVLRVKPDVPPVREWCKKSLESDIEKPHTRIYKVVEGQAESVQASDEIIAFAKWSSPHTEPPQEKPTEWPVGGDVALFREVVGKATEKRKRIMGEEEHWYLAVLATLPKHQRRGAGSLLMTELCKQADQSGHRSYVEASPLGKPTYQRFAFEERDTFSVLIDGEPYIDCCMVREPLKPS
ncbi:acyl-CoA N-acyltransferase [Mytilinidion resinicola]|uniref:Acyl-CoA N-acyltransferase n=1 Tax=Mytilinidion resinicola TaxID=574789 RepID=A0A6A6YLV8_9PEZI|nr:acyl-CoA N-acyltransferase [Mytilinidion resinicola]KAF2809780.1 acyl-CoA N-acyltransferase [Mytilinidion resinicola]